MIANTRSERNAAEAAPVCARSTDPQVHFPQVATINWYSIMNDPRAAIVFTNSVAQARRLCERGQPAIAVLGMSTAALTQWVRARGGKVRCKAEAN
jgi:hypothetical protein